jgi:hypothetical protein
VRFKFNTQLPELPRTSRTPQLVKDVCALPQEHELAKIQIPFLHIPINPLFAFFDAKILDKTHPSLGELVHHSSQHESWAEEAVPRSQTSLSQQTGHNAAEHNAAQVSCLCSLRRVADVSALSDEDSFAAC